MIIMQVQLLTKITFFLVLGLVILSVVPITVTYANAQLNGLTGSAMVYSTTMMAGTSSSSSTSPVSGKQFRAVLTGDNEVPPVDTQATGRIKIVPNPQQTALDFQISLSDLNGVVTGAHIHRGSIGTNGPVIATLNTGNAFAGALAYTLGSGSG